MHEENWEGYEALYALVNSSKIPHYGNDIEEADMLARFAALPTVNISKNLQLTAAYSNPYAGIR